MKAIEHLLHLHSCEQEGISSGMPTPQQWIDAVEAARKEHSALKEQEVVGYLCENGPASKIVSTIYETIEYKELGYTITELVKKTIHLEEQEVVYCIAEKDGFAQVVFYNDAPMLKAQGYTVTELVKK